MQHKGQRGNGEEGGKVEDENVQRSHFESDFLSTLFSKIKPLPQPDTDFGCDCWSQWVTWLWAPARLQSHRSKKTR